MKRNLDGVYFRVRRGDKYENLCFSDLTRDEQEVMMDGRDTEWLKFLCMHLADVIADMGNRFNIFGED